MNEPLPVGKLPPDLLRALLAQAPVSDERVLLRPGIGLDCAVVDLGERLLVFKSDPITFASDEMGWYLVQVNANDIATTGATPRWLLLTMLLPAGRTDRPLVEQLSAQVYEACRALEISVIGGHTEITHGLQRPLLIGTLVGEVARERLVTPQGMAPGDRLLLTKGVPIEAVAILAREFPRRLHDLLTEEEMAQARNYLYEPGISVLRDAQIAQQAGRVTAMHDPTEGGVAAALWEMAQASGRSLLVDLSAVPVPALAARTCDRFGLNPLATIASGALLLTAAAADAPSIRAALETAGIPCAVIGAASEGPAQVWQTDAGTAERTLLPCPEQDEIGRIYAGNEEER